MSNESVHFVKYRDKAKDWRWKLVARNGNVICDSGEGYHNEADCDRGISLVKDYAVSAEVRLA
jgi:uncharacterized protein YegP (UPF0339 family)